MILSYNNIFPQFAKAIFIAPNATIIGDVEIGEESSVWFNTVIRGDVNYIRIGSRTNIQDLTMCHVTLDKWPLVIGNGVTIGHGAVVHGCVIHDFCLIGMGARVLDGAEIGHHSLIAAGALVREGEKIPEYSLVAGVPAQIKRKLTGAEIKNLEDSAARYVSYSKTYLAAGVQHEGVKR
jgi:carbonic anhydrase/acetyltransferase-like protein (isoleucine patch superfamily)